MRTLGIVLAFAGACVCLLVIGIALIGGANSGSIEVIQVAVGALGMVVALGFAIWALRSN